MLIKELLFNGMKKIASKKDKSLLSDYDKKTYLLEAELVLCYVLGISREELVLDMETDISEEYLIKLFDKYIEEIVDGKPLAYILKSKEFYGMDFYVDERVLVPRPETEMLVDVVLEYLNEKAFLDSSFQANLIENAETVSKSVDFGRDFKVLDIGTGSGNIISAILKNYDNAVGVACDVSREALEVARENLIYHGLDDRCEIVESDLFAGFENEEEFDVIVTNPPYVAESEDSSKGFFTAELNVKKWEPKLALYAGIDGMTMYKKIIQELKDKKIKFNLLVGEFGAGQKDLILELLNKNFIQFEIEIKNDLAGIPRIFIVRKIK